MNDLPDNLNRSLQEAKIARDLMEREKLRTEQTLQELKETQSKLVLSDKMASLGQLVAGIAHELNTPLGAINSSIEHILLKHPLLINFFEKSPANLGVIFKLIELHNSNQKQSLTTREVRKLRKNFTAILEDKSISNASQLADTFADLNMESIPDWFLEFLKNEKNHSLLNFFYDFVSITQAAKNISIAVIKASKIVFALKSYSHINSKEEVESFNVNDTIDIVLTLYQNTFKKGIELTKELTKVPDINGFQDEIGQVWTNLIHNSIYAMKNTGTLTVRSYETTEQVVVEFEDNGPGIPKEIQVKIFEAFYTTKPQGLGSGLGLDLVKRTIKKHGGEIILFSEPGCTRFTILLPKKEHQQKYISAVQEQKAEDDRKVILEKKNIEERAKYQIESRNQLMKKKFEEFRVKEEALKKTIDELKKEVETLKKRS